MGFDVDNRFPWLLVAGSALALELSALYFQYGMDLAPCVLCVYQRAAVAGILLAGLVGALAPSLPLLRLLGYAGIATAAFIGIDLATHHVAIQRGEAFGCAFFAEFPSWAPLDTWLPAVFQPTGACGEIHWRFLGRNMPEWMQIVFGAYLAALGYALVMEVRRLVRVQAHDSR
jgi:disulfide bond formation protein DsbB